MWEILVQFKAGDYLEDNTSIFVKIYNGLLLPFCTTQLLVFQNCISTLGLFGHSALLGLPEAICVFEMAL